MNAPSSAARLVLGLDCSTTAAKVILVDPDGAVVGRGRRDLALDMPGPGRHEQDPRTWWEGTRGAIREALTGVDAGRVVALAMSHQRESFAYLDESGEPLRPAVLWVDSRAGAEVAELGTDRVHELSGKPPDVTPALYKMAWIARHEPDVPARAARVVDTHGYLVWCLTGRWATSWASADPLGLLDMQTFGYAPELLELAGVGLAQLCELVAPGAVIGTVRADVARDLGLGPSVPVAAGAGDGQCAGLGADITEPGRAYLNLGTAVVAGTDAADYRWSRAYRTLASPLAGRYTQETLLSSGAYLVGWFVRHFGSPGEAERGTPDASLWEEAAALPPGSDGLVTLPYWNCAQTPYWDPEASGAVLGWRGSHGRAHLFRSLLEGVAMELRLQWSGLEADLTGFRAVGGGARNALWPRIVADATRVPITLCAEPETSALGAAALAAGAVGLCGEVGDVRAAARAFCRLGETFEPDPATGPAYDRVYEVYSRLYLQLREIFPALARIGSAPP